MRLAELAERGAIPSFLEIALRGSERWRVERISRPYPYVYQLRQYDLFYARDIEPQQGPTKYLHSARVINHAARKTSKTVVSKAYERVFQRPLLVYYDRDPDPGLVVSKSEKQTIGVARIEEPTWRGRCYNRIAGKLNETYGAYIIDGELVYLYKFTAPEGTPAKLKSVIERTYYTPEESHRMLDPHMDQIRTMLDLLWVDLCRIDMGFDPDGTPVIYDVNSSPFEENHKDPMYQKTGLQEYARSVVEKALDARMEMAR